MFLLKWRIERWIAVFSPPSQQPLKPPHTSHSIYGIEQNFYAHLTILFDPTWYEDHRNIEKIIFHSNSLRAELAKAKILCQNGLDWACNLGGGSKN